MAIYKYERISTKRQSIERQKMMISNLGIQFDKTYVDKITANSEDRPQLNQLKFDTVKGDIVYVESISKIGQNVDDLRAICDYFNNKEVEIYFIKEGISTNSSYYKFMITIFGAVAEMEKENKIARMQEEMERAKETGITKMIRVSGRKNKTAEDLPKNFKKYYFKMINGEFTKKEIAKLLQCSRSTLYRWIELYEKECHE